MKILIYLNGNLKNLFDPRVKRLKMIALGLNENGIIPSFVYTISKEENHGDKWWIDENGFQCKAIFFKPRSGIANKIIPNNLRLSKSFLSFLQKDENGFDIVLLYNSAMLSYLPILDFCRLRKIKCITDLTEWYPSSLKRMISVNFWDHFLFRKFKMERYDGIISISSLWERYTSNKNIPTVRVPSLCDPKDIPYNDSSTTNSVFQLVYIGRLSDRDLPYTMIEGIKLADAKGIPIKLIIIGNVNRHKTGLQIKKLATTDPQIKRLIKFTGFVETDEMNHLLNSASANILLRSDDSFSNGCFPTRLPEYLLTAQPLITSAIHDFNLYLKDNVNACLITPGNNPHELCDKIEYLFNNRDKSKLIGEAGRASALQNFSLSFHGKNISQFLRQFYPAIKHKNPVQYD